MGLGTAATAGIVGGIGAAGSIASSAIGAHAAGSAADKQVSAQERALQQEQANQQPYLDFGKTSLSQISQQFPNGFTAPTQQEAEATPGYQFTQDEGDSGILKASAALGGSISGGTLKSLSQYNQGLATTNYNNIFNQKLQSYMAALQGVQIGQGATQNLNSSLSSVATNVGNAQAAGTVGSANAISGGLGSATNSITQSLLLSQLLNGTGAGSSGGSVPAPTLSQASNFGLTQPANIYAGVGPG